MSDEETDFVAALEPLVVELEGLRRALADMRTRLDDRSELEGLRRALEPQAAELDGLRRDLAALHARLEDRTELDGLRRSLEALERYRDAPAWAAGVYRQGAIVQHFHGQVFEAAADTALEPGDGVAWRRIGSAGFRFRGLKVDGMAYEHGDLVQEAGGTLLQAGDRLTWLAIRGTPGPRGAPGEGRTGPPGRDGQDGARGADGAMLVKLEANAGLLWAVMSDGRREPLALEAVQLEGSHDG